MAYQDKKKKGMRLPEDNNNINIELNMQLFYSDFPLSNLLGLLNF
jgi:hypothetical protein